MGEVSAASVRCVCALALFSTSCPVCGRPYRCDSRSGSGHSNTAIQHHDWRRWGTLLRHFRRTVKQWSELGGLDGQTHFWIIIALINTTEFKTLWHMLTRLPLSDACPFLKMIYILFLLCTCLHTYSDRVVTRSGHCSVLSDLTSLSVSLIWPETTPLPVHVRMHVWRSVHGQTAKRRP